MSLQIRYFASLRERMGRASDAVESADASSVAEVWARVSGNQPFPSNALVAVNMEFADLSREVKEGDEIAFFPPVTGG